MAAPRRPIPAHLHPTSLSDSNQPGLGHTGRPGASHGRRLSDEQRAAIRAVMQIFVEDDLAGGMRDDERLPCDACHLDQAAPGFIKYDDLAMCNSCAIDYETARAEGNVFSAADFVRLRPRPATRPRPFLTRIK